jgi:hypothetical protein
MKSIILGLLTIATLTFVACNKDEDTSSSNSGRAGGTGGTAHPTNPSTCNFAPYRLGSKIEQLLQGATYNFEVTKATTIGADKYFVMKSSTGVQGMYVSVEELHYNKHLLVDRNNGSK